MADLLAIFLGFSNHAHVSVQAFTEIYNSVFGEHHTVPDFNTWRERHMKHHPSHNGIVIVLVNVNGFMFILFIGSIIYLNNHRVTLSLLFCVVLQCLWLNIHAATCISSAITFFLQITLQAISSAITVLGFFLANSTHTFFFAWQLMAVCNLIVDLSVCCKLDILHIVSSALCYMHCTAELLSSCGVHRPSVRKACFCRNCQVN